MCSAVGVNYAIYLSIKISAQIHAKESDKIIILNKVIFSLECDTPYCLTLFYFTSRL